jgi:hypothetical protein
MKKLKRMGKMLKLNEQAQLIEQDQLSYFRGGGGGYACDDGDACGSDANANVNNVIKSLQDNNPDQAGKC